MAALPLPLSGAGTEDRAARSSSSDSASSGSSSSSVLDLHTQASLSHLLQVCWLTNQQAISSPREEPARRTVLHAHPPLTARPGAAHRPLCWTCRRLSAWLYAHAEDSGQTQSTKSLLLGQESDSHLQDLRLI